MGLPLVWGMPVSCGLPQWCALSTVTDHHGAENLDGVVLERARRRKERTDPELVGPRKKKSPSCGVETQVHPKPLSSQTTFIRNHFHPMCLCEWGGRFGRVGGPEGWGPKGWGTEGWGLEGWGCPKFRSFFLLPPQFSFFLLSLGGPFVGIWWGFLKCRGLEMCNVWSSRAVVCEPPAARSGGAAGSFTRQPESPNEHI